LLLIKENPEITAKEIAQYLSVNSRTVERILFKMQKNNIIEREGPTKSGKWKLKSDNEVTNKMSEEMSEEIKKKKKI